MSDTTLCTLRLPKNFPGPATLNVALPGGARARLERGGERAEAKLTGRQITQYRMHGIEVEAAERKAKSDSKPKKGDS